MSKIFQIITAKVKYLIIALIEHSSLFRKLASYILPGYLEWKRNKINKNFLKNGAFLLEKFKKCLDKEGIKFWLTCGTLLGAYREKRLLGHDLDLDVAMFAEDKETAQKALINGGFQLLHEFKVLGEEILEQAYSYKGTKIDIFYIVRENQSFTTYSFYKKEITTKNDDFFVIKMIFPETDFISYEFLGGEYLIPAKTEEYLTANYGKGFMTPNTTWDYTKDIPSAIYYSLGEKRGECIFHS